MTTKKLIVAAALVAGAALGTVGLTAPTLAQAGYDYGSQRSAPFYGYGYGNPAGWHAQRYYDYYGSAPLARPDYERGGPGPRVLDGSGMGIDAER